MIIDAHSHIKAGKNFNNDYINFINDLNCNNIDKAIVSIDPFTKDFKCKHDEMHYVSINDYGKKVRTKCHTCNTEKIYDNDPFEKYNEQLFSINDPKIIPFLMLSVTNNTMEKTAKKFLEVYNNKIAGLKLYTGLSEVYLDDIRNFDFELPLLIHVGYQHNQNPKNMIEFLKKYRGNVILAHYARFSQEAIDLIKCSDNIFIDTSPTMYLYDHYIKDYHKGGLINRDGLILPEDFYYKAIETVGIDKMVFGTDYPFSDRKIEIDLLNKLNLSNNDYEKITNGNIKRILRRNLND